MKSVQRFVWFEIIGALKTRESQTGEDDVAGDDSILEFSLSSLC